MNQQFTDAIVAISRHFGVLERDTVCCGDVTVQQCVALQRLHRSPAGVSALADYLGKSASATTRLVDGMQQRGWIERQPHPDDGRRVQLVLTDEGRSRAQELRSSTEEMARQLLAYIDEDKREDVVASLMLLESAIADCRRSSCGSFGCGDSSQSAEFS